MIKYIDRACHMIDEIFPEPSQPGKVAIFIDCRTHTSFVNPPASKMLGFFKQMSITLGANYPGRIGKIVIYPISKFLVGIIAIIMQMFDKETREKLIFVSGNARMEAGAPKGLWAYLESSSELPENVRKWHNKNR